MTILTTDDELLQSVADGDPAAFGSLYQKYRKPVYAYCFRILTDHDETEDAVQDTFLKARRSLSTLQRRGSFGPWLFTIARNEAYQRLKSTARSVPLQGADVWDSRDLESELGARDQDALVGNVISRLRLEYREVLLLREYAGLSYAEIAAIIGETESVVKSRLFRARRALYEKVRHLI